jgi:uncharacterized protein with beta-barrel porin domain
MNSNIKMLLRFMASAFAAILTMSLSTAQPTGSQAVLNRTTDWTGAVDSDYFNPANWTNGVPDGSTDIGLVKSVNNVNVTNKVLNITHSAGGNRDVELYSLRTEENYTHTINIVNTSSSGTLNFIITGRGTHPFLPNQSAIGGTNRGDWDDTGGTSSRNNLYITAGDNTRISFAADVFKGYTNNGSVKPDTDNIPLPSRDTSGFLYAYTTLTGNAVLDGRTMDRWISIASGTGVDPAGTVSYGSSWTRMGSFNVGPDATVYLGMGPSHVSVGIGNGMEATWEGLVVQDEFDPSKLPADLYGAELPVGVTRDMLTLPEGSASTMKWGAGITRVTTTGTTLHPGIFTLRAGGYVVDGYHRGPIRANTGSYLGGKGRIDGNVTIDSSNSITGGDRNGAGKLTITGSVTLNGALSIDLTSWDGQANGQDWDGAYTDANGWDRIQINGDLTIGTTSSFVVGRSEDFALSAGTFRVLNYTGARTGEFGTVSLPQSQGLAAAWAWVGNNLEITFTQLAYGDNPNLIDNYHGIAVFLDNANAAGGVPSSLFNTLNRQPSVAYFKQVLDQITSISYQAWFPSAVLRASSMVQSVEDRMMQDAGYGRAKSSVQTYLQGWRQESSRDADVDAAYSSYDTYAVLVGADYALAENTVAGGYLSYDSTDFTLDNYGSTSTGKGYTFGIYARHNRGAWQFNATAFYGNDDYSTRRNVHETGLGSWLDSDADGSRLGMAVSAAYIYKHPWLEIVPVAGLQWVNWKADAFTETGWAEEGMTSTVRAQNETSLQARLGARFTRAFESSRGFIRPYLHMAYVREFNTGRRDMTSDLFGDSLTIKAPGIEGNGMRVDAGVEWQLAKAWRWDLHYTAQYNNACDKSVGVRAGVTFVF